MGRMKMPPKALLWKLLRIDVDEDATAGFIALSRAVFLANEEELNEFGNVCYYPSKGAKRGYYVVEIEAVIELSEDKARRLIDLIDQNTALLRVESAQEGRSR